jgi:septum formation protein
MIRWPFEVRVPEIEEAIRPNESIKDYILRNSMEKTRAVDEQKNLVLAADTVVIYEGDLLEKPTDTNDAVKMLTRLSGNTHTVWTSFSLLNPVTNKHFSEVVESRVHFRDLDKAEIETYVASGSPMDKSGSYGIQDDIGAGFVKSIAGSYTNIVGLPLAEVIEAVKKIHK